MFTLNTRLLQWLLNSVIIVIAFYVQECLVNGNRNAGQNEKLIKCHNYYLPIKIMRYLGKSKYPNNNSNYVQIMLLIFLATKSKPIMLPKQNTYKLEVKKLQLN